MNKTKLYLGLLGAIVLAGLIPINKSPAQGNPSKARAEVVLLHTYNYWTNGSMEVFIYRACGSGGAPKIPDYPRDLTPAAQAIADLITEGYEIKQVTDIDQYASGKAYVMVKPAH